MFETHAPHVHSLYSCDHLSRYQSALLLFRGGKNLDFQNRSGGGGELGSFIAIVMGSFIAILIDLYHDFVSLDSKSIQLLYGRAAVKLSV